MVAFQFIQVHGSTLIDYLASGFLPAQPGLAGSSAWDEVLAASRLATLLVLALQRQFVRGILSESAKE